MAGLARTGNLNDASSTTLSFDFDKTQPTVVISGGITDGSHGCTDPVVFTVTFSEDVVGVSAAAFSSLGAALMLAASAPAMHPAVGRGWSS